jgi:hypothetical protein
MYNRIDNFEIFIKLYFLNMFGISNGEQVSRSDPMGENGHPRITVELENEIAENVSLDTAPNVNIFIPADNFNPTPLNSHTAAILKENHLENTSSVSDETLPMDGNNYFVMPIYGNTFPPGGEIS